MLQTSLLKKLLTGCTLFCSVQAFSQSTSRTVPPAYPGSAPINYVRTWEAVAPITDANTLTTATTIDKAQMTTQYMDGLGRPVQTVSKGVTPLGKDMVSAVEYDEFGREPYQYLPFAANSAGGNASISDGMFKFNPFEQQAEFYGNASTSPIKGQGETFYYGQTLFEASPLNRVVKTMAAGNSWVGAARGVEVQYLINTASDSVRIWTVSSTVATVPVTTAAYNAGELYKTVTVDENAKQVVEYKDKEGKVILKKVQLSNTPSNAHVGWLCTYYVYDDLGNLRFVLQPKAVETLLSNGNWTITTTMRDELCFYYGYDGRNRMVIKKVPGAAEVWMVYDKRDRLVMTQDANQRMAGKWLVTLYDELNRPVKTGLWTESHDRSYHEGQAAATANYYYPFTATATPATGFETLSETGYDDYSSLPSGAPSGTLDNSYITAANFDLSYNTAPQYAQSLSQSLQTRGMVTWTKVKVLNASPEKYLYSVSIYDEKGRVIQVKSKNISDGVDVLTTQYDFSGKVLRTHTKHEKAGVNATVYQVLTINSYDAAGRLIMVKKRVNSNTTANTTDKLIVQNSYDELGQLKQKNIGEDPNSTSNPLETLTYDYNIRGWLLGANRDYAKSATSTSHYFGFDLGYDKQSIVSGATAMGSYSTAQLNGNIAGMVWKSTGDDQLRKYDFSYDNVNRLTAADFNQYTGGFNKDAGLDFSVSGLSYDGNGNILSMNQKGWKGTSSTTIDQLTYTYASNSNKLQNVVDASQDKTTRLGDFRYSALYESSVGVSKSSGATDYYYDANGNLVKDFNKDIESYTGANGIEYNYLNLPQKITVRAGSSADKGTIEYTYDAAGNKLKKVTTEGSKVTTTLYLYGTYQNDTLQFLPMEEGRVRPSVNNSSGFVYDYFIKDHLGNVRMMLTEEEQTNYYPAATMEGSPTAGAKSMLGWEKQFYTIDNTKITATSLIPGWSSGLNYANNNGNPPYNSIASGSYPSDYTVSDGGTSASMYKLNAQSNKTGLGFVVKVMAGDVINIFGKSYYSSTASFTNSNSTALGLADIFTAFLNTMNNAAAAGGISEQNMESLNSGSYALPTSFIRGNDNTSSTSPKAYINYMFFDEQFRYAGGSFSRVGSSGTVKNQWTDAQLQNILAEKSGYLYVYVSNESNIDVFFDNLQVVHKRGAILEESHYYPFGLTMSGISSRAAGGIQNRYKFNGGTELENKEFSDGSGLDLYSTDFRSYDPQIGRFHQIDPLADEDDSWGQYVFAYNNPILINDPLGLQGDSTQPQKPLPLPRGFAPNPVTDPNAPKGSEANPIPTGVNVVVTSGSQNNSASLQPVYQPILQYVPIVVTPSGSSGSNNASGMMMAAPMLMQLTPQQMLLTGGFILGAGMIISIMNQPGLVYPVNYFASPDNLTHKPFILESKGKGERNQTARPDGTDNPFKKLKPDPKKPGNVLEKNSHTGKTVSKPAPPGFFEWWDSKKH